MIYNLCIVRAKYGWEIHLTWPDGLTIQKIMCTSIDMDLAKAIDMLVNHPDSLVLYII